MGRTSKYEECEVRETGELTLTTLKILGYENMGRKSYGRDGGCQIQNVFRDTEGRRKTEAKSLIEIGDEAENMS